MPAIRGSLRTVRGSSNGLRRSLCLCVFHPLVLEQFQRLLEGEPYQVLTCRLDPGGIAHREHFRIPRASVYVVDVPRRRQDAEFVLSEILARVPKARVLVVAERADEATSFAMLRLGVKGILRYAEVSERVLRALQTVVVGGFWVPRALLSRFIDETLLGSRNRTVGRVPAGLSRREKEVLELLLENFSNKEIAGRLNISARTAKFHVSNVLAKYRVSRRADLLLTRFA
jgi:DNA-binding NarL/FixJ family response regulator